VRPSTNLSLYKIDHFQQNKIPADLGHSRPQIGALASVSIGEAHQLDWKIAARCACGKWSGIIDMEHAVIVDCGWLSEIWNLRSCQGVSYWSAVPSHWSRACLNRSTQ
jgi:hypothetical protein